MLKAFQGLKKKYKILYALLIAFGLVFFWRGTWLILDYILFPRNTLLSGITCLIVAFIILIPLTHYLLKFAE